MEIRKPPAAPTAQASHDADSPPALVDFMSTGWLDAPMAAASIPQMDRFRSRRQALSRAFPGTYLLIPSGTEKVRANDTNFRFRPSSDFAYLVGAGEPDGLLVLEPREGGHDAVLFVPPHNRGEAAFFTDRVRGELWVGRHRGVRESQIVFWSGPVPAALGHGTIHKRSALAQLRGSQCGRGRRAPQHFSPRCG